MKSIMYFATYSYFAQNLLVRNQLYRFRARSLRLKGFYNPFLIISNIFNRLKIDNYDLELIISSF